MKKYLLVMLITMILLTGCGKNDTNKKENTESKTTTTKTTEAAMNYSKVAGEYFIYIPKDIDYLEFTESAWWLFTEDGKWERQGSYCEGYERYSGNYTVESKDTYDLINVEYDGVDIHLKLEDGILTPESNNLPEGTPIIMVGTDCANLEWDKWTKVDGAKRVYESTENTYDW